MLCRINEIWFNRDHWKGIHVTARVYEAVKSDIEYTRDKTVQYIKAKDMITEYIKIARIY